MAAAGLLPPCLMALGSVAYIRSKFSRKCHNNSKKEREGGDEKGVRRRW
jgi:hypothetical protein